MCVMGNGLQSGNRLADDRRMGFLTIRLLASRPALDKYDVTKRARGLCSMPGCVDMATVEITKSHAGYGLQTLALCPDHLMIYRPRKRGP